MPLNLHFLATASLIQLVNEHSALNARLNLSGAKLWAEQYAEDEAALAAVWQAIGRRFPRYIARQKRLAADRAEHERRIRSDEPDVIASCEYHRINSAVRKVRAA